MNKSDREARHIAKRVFDVIGASAGLIALGWLICILWLIAAIETQSNGFFLQNRVGRHGTLFKIIKIKTMKNPAGRHRSSVTVAGSAAITRSGAFLRRFKLDELPQLWNVLIGNMSFVGPRPDVPGFADELAGNDRLILSLRPGITGPASLAFRDEEEILAQVEDPEAYNREIIWPEKVRLNRDYLENFSLWGDLKLIFLTLKS